MSTERAGPLSTDLTIAALKLEVKLHTLHILCTTTKYNGRDKTLLLRESLELLDRIADLTGKLREELQ